MHWLLLVTSVLFVLAAGAIAGEPSTAREPDADAARADEIRVMSYAYFKQCMNDWDAATHMTKNEWESTCRRIADERARFRGEEWGR
jgi:hypothetical protein